MKIIVEILTNLAIQRSIQQPLANPNFHVRDLFPAAFWFALPIGVRLQVGRRFYYATTANFMGFDLDHVAIYNY
jgi:hypothetical protein